MFFYIKKILGTLAMPLPLVLVTAALGILLLWQKWFPKLGKRTGKLCLLFSFIWAAIFGNVGISAWLLGGLENRYPAMPELSTENAIPQNLAACKYVLVLGGGANRHEQRSALAQLNGHSLARLAEGIRLARMLPDAKLIVSGYGKDGGSTMAHEYERAAVSLGFAAERIVRFDEPRDTREEITAFQKQFGSAPVAVVTSAFHQERAMALCRELRVNAVPCPTAFVVHPATVEATDFFRWDLGAFGSSAQWFHEWLGRLFA